jgi:hypothetical protein
MSHGFLAPVLNRDREQAEVRSFFRVSHRALLGAQELCFRVLCPLLDPRACAFHGGSPRDRWSCVLPKGQINVNVNSAPSGLVGVGVDEGGAFAICFSPRVLRRFASDTPGRERS